MVNTPRRQPERAPLAPTQSSPTLTRQLTATAVMTLLATGCGPELIIEPHSMGYTVTATEGTSTLTIDDVPAESLNHLKIAWNWDELLEAAHQIDIEGDYTKTTIEGRIESCLTSAINEDPYTNQNGDFSNSKKAFGTPQTQSTQPVTKHGKCSPKLDTSDLE